MRPELIVSSTGNQWTWGGGEGRTNYLAQSVSSAEAVDPSKAITSYSGLPISLFAEE